VRLQPLFEQVVDASAFHRRVDSKICCSIAQANNQRALDVYLD